MLKSCLAEAIPLTQSCPIVSRQATIKSVMLHINTRSRSLLVYHAHSPTPLPLPSGVWGYVRVTTWPRRWVRGLDLSMAFAYVQEGGRSDICRELQ